MKLLYYTWGENSFSDTKETFEWLNYEMKIFRMPVKDYAKDAEFEQKLEEILKAEYFDFIFTYDYFPVISDVAERVGIKYAAWIYDCPHLTLYSTTIRNKVNYIFAFDYVQYMELKERGAEHVFHFPLAVNRERIARRRGIDWEDKLPGHDKLFDRGKHTYLYDVSFVGSLYEKGLYRQIHYLPEKLKGYFDGIMAAQEKVWGYDFIGEVLTEEVVKEFFRYVQISMEGEYEYTGNVILRNMLHAEITGRERKKYLEQLGADHEVALFSASENVVKSAHIKELGYVSYIEKMPDIFWRSKINLNFTLRSITSGIPLRALDVMGAGGFLLSNYQPELAEYFVPGEEFVFFEDENDLSEKVNYYLSHEEEREKIAYRGWLKTEKFSYRNKLKELSRLLGN